MMAFHSLRFTMACIVALIMLWHIYDEDKAILSPQPQIYVYGCILPVYFLALAIAALLLYTLDHAMNMILSMCFDTFFVISLYYGLMSLLIKPLRKTFSAKACGLLWLVPNYLYFLQRSNAGMEQERPLLILQLPGNLAEGLLLIWLAGFLLFLGIQMYAHLQFRHLLLSGSRSTADETVGRIWEAEKERLSLEGKPYRLLFSPNTTTPLSIGLLEKSTVVVLPEKEYTSEELTFILRHELTHIYRGDCFTKLFLTICTAMCWFNPLMWRAMKKCAEDLELSCDERVLQNATAEQRKQYADLILTTAGDQRGFTTCLSATASSLTYRLKNILHPKKKRWGGFLAAAVFLLLAMSCGHISLAYTEESGSEVIYLRTDPADFRINHISLSTEQFYSTLECREPEKLSQYLSQLRVKRITGEYRFSQCEQELFVIYAYNGEYYRICIRDQILIVTPYQQNRVGDAYYFDQYYIIEQAVDWEYLRSLMEYGPGLKLHIPTEDGTETVTATLYNLDRIENGESSPVRRGSETTDIDHLLDNSSDKIRLQFSHRVLDYTVTIENWTHTEVLTLSSKELKESDTIPLLQRNGHYSVHALLQAENGIQYDAEFRFDIHDITYGEQSTQ